MCSRYVFPFFFFFFSFFLSSPIFSSDPFRLTFCFFSSFSLLHFSRYFCRHHFHLHHPCMCVCVRKLCIEYCIWFFLQIFLLVFFFLPQNFNLSILSSYIFLVSFSLFVLFVSLFVCLFVSGSLDNCKGKIYTKGANQNETAIKVIVKNFLYSKLLLSIHTHSHRPTNNKNENANKGISKKKTTAIYVEKESKLWINS